MVSQLLLEVRDVESFYDTSQALFGMTFSVHRGEFATLIGRNGMGKTTTVKNIVGLMRPRRGTITLEGRSLDSLPAFRIARLGLGLVPEGRRVFGSLSVKENLVATANNKARHSNPWTLERVYELFPSLKRREHGLGSTLSGGEQQMLAIGRALMTNPQLLILDEATEGLAPLVRHEIWKCLAQLKAMGQTIIVIDRNIGPLLRLADTHHVVEKGRVLWSGSSESLRRAPEVLHKYVGV